MPLECREVSDAAGLAGYERLNRASPHGSVFSAASWYTYQNLQREVIGVYKGAELVGGCVLHQVDGKIPAIVPGTPWSGPICRTQREGECLAVAESLAEYLLRRYTDVSLTLPPEWVDVRGFLWAGMRSHVRYTYRGWSSEMQYEPRVNLRAIKAHLGMVHESKDWDHLRYEYGDSLVDVLRDHPRQTRYYWKANEGGTWHSELVDAMIQGARVVDYKIDMVGCNSPKRGLFKRQFGGVLTPYYVVTTLDTKQIAEFWPPREAHAA